MSIWITQNKQKQTNFEKHMTFLNLFFFFIKNTLKLLERSKNERKSSYNLIFRLSHQLNSIHVNTTILAPTFLSRYFVCAALHTKETADLVTFTEKILNGKHSLCSEESDMIVIWKRFSAVK